MLELKLLETNEVFNYIGSPVCAVKLDHINHKNDSLLT